MVALLFLVAVLVFFWPIFTGKVISGNDTVYLYSPYSMQSELPNQRAHNYLLFDQPFQFFVYKSFLLENVRKGVWPLWNPYSLCGNNFSANILAQAFNPLTYLGLMFPVPLADTIADILKIFLAAFGTYLLLRRHGLTDVPSIFGSLAFAFSSYNIAWLNHPPSAVSVALPWLLWGINRLQHEGRHKPGNMAWLAIIVSLAFAGGHPDTILKVLFLAGLYVCFLLGRTLLSRKPVETAGTFTWHFSGLVLGIGLAAVIWLPFYDFLMNESITIEQRRNSAISSVTSLRDAAVALLPRLNGSPMTINDTSSTNFLENGMFVGLAPLIITLLAIPLAVCRRRGDFLFFLAAGLSILSAMMGIEPFSWLLRHVPLLVHTSILRMTLPLQFCTAMTGAIGLFLISDCLGQRNNKWIVGWLAAGSTTLALICGITGFLLRDVDGIFVFLASGIIVPGAVLLASRFSFGRPLVAPCATFVLFIELFLLQGDINPAITPEMANLKEPPLVTSIKQNAGSAFFRIAAKESILGPNLPALFGVRDVRGYDLPMARRLMDFASHAFYGGRWDFGIIYQSCGAPILDPANRNITDLLGVRYILKMNTSNNVAIIVNSSAFPHAFVPGNVVNARTVPDAVSAMRQGICAVESDLPAGFTGSAGKARIVSENVNGAEMEVEAQGAALLVFSEMPLKGWRAEVDGKRVSTMAVNVVQQGVWLTPGKHVVRFRFMPSSFMVGLVVSALSALAVAICIIISTLKLTRPAKEAEPVVSERT